MTAAGDRRWCRRRSPRSARRHGGVTGLTVAEMTIQLPSSMLTLFQQTDRGRAVRQLQPVTIPRLLELYRSGDLKLDEMVAPNRYRLDQVNEGYGDMLDGLNVRGVVIHEHMTGSPLESRTPDAVVGRERKSRVPRGGARQWRQRCARGFTRRREEARCCGRRSRRATRVAFFLVEGDASSAPPARLLGHFDPALVLARLPDRHVRGRSASSSAMRRRSCSSRSSTRYRGDAQRPAHGDVEDREIAVPRLGGVVQLPGLSAPVVPR